MKKSALLIVLVIMSISRTTAQPHSDTITEKKVVGGYQYFQNKKMLNMPQLAKAIKSNEQSRWHISKAETNKTFATIFGGVGGFMVGWTLGTVIGGGEPNWTICGIGAGLIVVSIPLSSKANRETKRAVDAFNDSRRGSSFLDRSEVNFGAAGNQIGLSLHF